MSNLDISVISADAVPAAQRSKNEAPGASPDHYPQVLRWTRASGTTGGKGEVPSLAKEGTPRHQVNGPVPLEARPGWFVPLPIIGGLNQPPRLRPRRRLRGIFLMGAATPPFPRRGLRLSLQLFSMPPVLPRSIQSCPAGQLHNRKEVGGTKTKNLSAYFLERGISAPFKIAHHHKVLRMRIENHPMSWKETTASALKPPRHRPRSN